jgi:hypothetical protein
MVMRCIVCIPGTVGEGCVEDLRGGGTKIHRPCVTIVLRRSGISILSVQQGRESRITLTVQVN